MDEITKLRTEVAKLRSEVADIKRQPERQLAQVQAVLPVLLRLLIGMGVEERAARRWQELVIAADDPGRLRMANLDLFSLLDSCTEARRLREDEIEEHLHEALLARLPGGPPQP